jgi:hypothetical protein
MKESKIFLINEESRQHINLSTKANTIIEADMIRFNFDYDLANKSGFINKIITNYYDNFPLSKNIALKQLHTIQKAIKYDTISEKVTTRIIDEFTNEIMKNTINEYAKKYEFDVQLKIKLNKENTAILSSLEEAKYFEEYAPRSGIGFYLKIILESYSDLSREEREKIFFRELIDQINIAIVNNSFMVIKDGKQVKKVKPQYVKLSNDRLCHELVFVVPFEDSEYILGQIDHIKIKKLKKQEVIFLKNTEVSSKIRITPSDNNCDGLDSSQLENEKFVIEFTDNGLNRFFFEEDSLSIYGIPDKNNEHKYTFYTTETKIFMNLFKFGLQARIISPASARDKFKELYKASYEAYNDKNVSEKAII